MQLDKKSREVILESLKQAIPTNKTARVSELRAMVAAGADISLQSFLKEAGLDLEDVYSNNSGWSELCEAAGITVRPAGPHEKKLRRGIGRLLHLDDPARIETSLRLLTAKHCPRWSQLDVREQRFARMLAAQLGDQAFDKSQGPEDAWPLLWRHPQVLAECAELMGVLAARVDHLHRSLDTHPDVPLVVHARYTRLEILAAFGDGDRAKVAAWQTGVRYLKKSKADLLAFTLDKTSGDFSPTTRYRDYAISRDLIHWESQSVTRADSDTGLRYQNHQRQGSTVLLFARHNKYDRAFWFLGPATYVEHRGEKPMAITWRLEHPLPGDLFTQFAAAVA